MKPRATLGQVALPANLRLFLHATIVVTGAAILILEIIGARMLTPFFGSSHFVWSAQIAITMLALAVGYRLGGTLAQRGYGAGGLCAAILLAGLYLIGTVAWRIPLARACLTLKLSIGSTLASFALFFVPLALLATAGPLVVRLLTTSLHDVGRQVGRLSAVGTVGSLFGVVLASHVLIPRVRDSVALLGTAVFLLILVAVYTAGWGRRSKLVGGTVAAAIFMLIGIPEASKRDRIPVWSGYQEIARTNSHFGLMQVIESDDRSRRFYLNDFLIQNSFDTQERKSVSVFTEMLYGLSRAYTGDLRRALCLGMGVGIVPMRLARDGIQVDVVEINPAVVPLAQRFFDFDPSKVNLFVDDARHFLESGTNQYQTVQLDAFVGDATPAHLMTQEAFAAIHRRLEPGGTLVINAITTFESGRDFMATSIHRTLKSVFRQVVVHASAGGNVFYVASDRDPLIPLRTPDFSQVHWGRRAETEAAFAQRVSVDPGSGLVLTDDYNPAEYRDAPNREDLRRRLTQLALGH